MPTATASTRQRLTVEEVIASVRQQLPGLVEHMYIDRDWIWYCGPDLKGDHNSANREALKQIGFRFSMRGHLMPDKQTVGHWGHSCDRPMFRRRRPARPVSRPSAPSESIYEDIHDGLAQLLG